MHGLHEPGPGLTVEERSPGGAPDGAFDKCLLVAGDKHRYCHSHDADALQPKRPFPFPAAVGQSARHPDIAAPALQGDIDERNVDRCIGAEESQMAVGRRPLCAMGIQVDLRQCLHEAPDAGAEEIAESMGDQPGQRRVIVTPEAVAAGVIDGVHDHCHQRNRLQRGEESAQAKPVFRRADPEIVVSEAENARAEHQRDFDVQPRGHDPAARAQRLHQSPGHDAADQHFPCGFHPEMHYPPPPVLVHGQIGGVEHSCKIQSGQGNQIEHQGAGNAAPAALDEGRRDVVEEHAGADDNADIGPARRLDVFAPFVDKPDAGLGAGADLHEEIDEHDNRHSRGQNPEIDIGQLRADQFGAGFVLDQPVDRADKSVQHPHDHRVQMHHAVDAEIKHAEQEVRIDELQAGQQAEYGLRREQHHRGDEIFQRQFLPFGKSGFASGGLADAGQRDVSGNGHAHSPPWGSGVNP